MSRIGVLLIHGLTGTPTEMSPIERVMKKAGMLVETPLLAGHGLSNEELLQTSWQDWAKSTKPALKRLLTQCESVFVAGLCMGSMLSIVVTHDEPKIKGLMLLSPDGPYPARNASMWSILLPIAFRLPRFLQKKMYWVEKPPYGIRDPDIQAEITYSIEQSKNREAKQFGTFRTYISSFHETALLRKKGVEAAKKITCPTLIIQSTEDTLMDPKNAAFVYEKLGCKEKKIVYITGCDHVITVDLKRKEVAARLVEFIEEIAGRGASDSDQPLQRSVNAEPSRS